MSVKMYDTSRSSCIKAIGYDKVTKQLYVDFKSGGSYVYLEVPEVYFKEWSKAPSFGKFFWKFIRPTFDFIRNK